MRARSRLLASILAALSAAIAVVALAAPPLVNNSGFVHRYVSPNGDGVADSLLWFFTLAGDPATLTVHVREDSSGTGGAIVATIWNDLTALGTDTLSWDGNDALGDPAPEGRYWIDARASNTEGTFIVPQDSFVVDRTAPHDSVTTPPRTSVPGLVHLVQGWATDARGLDSLTVTVRSTGGELPNAICAPCTDDTTFFGIDVPDAIALADTVFVFSRAVDRAGNLHEGARAFAVDSLPPPAPTLDPLPATVDRPSVVVSGSASDAESVHVRQDGALLSRLRVTGGRFQLTAALPSLGEHRFDAIAIDRAGNQSAPSAEVSVVYVEPIGIVVPEHFLAGDRIQVNVPSPAQRVTVRVLTLAGRLVRAFETAGGPNFEFVWDLNDEDGNAAGSGPYVVSVTAALNDGSAFEKRVAMVVTR